MKHKTTMSPFPETAHLFQSRQAFKVGQVAVKNLLARPFRTIAMATALGTVMVLSACSSVPDAANPVEWAKSVGDAFSGDEEEATPEGTPEEEAAAVRAERGQEAPGADADFPDLNAVPSDAPKRSSAEERAELAEGLVADRDGRQYSDEVIQRQGAAVNPLRSDAPPPPPEVGQAPASSAPSTMAPSTITPATPATDPVIAGRTSPSSVGAPQGTAGTAIATDASVPLPTRPPEGADVIAFYQAKLDEQRRMQAEMARRTDELMGTPTMDIRPVAGGNPFETVVVGAEGVEGGPDFGTQVVSAAGTPTTGASADVPDGATHVATIQFRDGSSALSSRDRRILRDVRQLQQERGGRVRVVGHASSRTQNMDKVRHMMVNYNVSVQRAEVITRELMRLGVPSEAIVVAAVSDSDPKYFEVMPSGEAGNRRAEIFLEN
ncbi:MAG: OmpA family protein [Magnetovibrionaceae bacterium]